MKRNCLNCQKEFISVSRLHLCCSKYCAEKYRISKTTKKPKLKSCKHCEKEFKPYTSLDKFCSTNCRIKNVQSKRSRCWAPEKAQKRLGENNPAYKHGLSVRGVIVDSTGLRLFRKNRDEYKQQIIDEKGFLSCERCGHSNVRFHTHHIVFRSEKPNHEHLHSKDNMTVVCVPCHNWYHNSKSNRNKIVLERKLYLLFGNDILNK